MQVGVSAAWMFLAEALRRRDDSEILLREKEFTPRRKDGMKKIR